MEEPDADRPCPVKTELRDAINEVDGPDVDAIVAGPHPISPLARVANSPESGSATR